MANFPNNLDTMSHHVFLLCFANLLKMKTSNLTPLIQYFGEDPFRSSWISLYKSFLQILTSSIKLDGKHV